MLVDSVSRRKGAQTPQDSLQPAESGGVLPKIERRGEMSWQTYLATAIPIPPLNSGFRFQHSVLLGKVIVLILLAFYATLQSMWNLRVIILFMMNLMLLFYLLAEKTVFKTITSSLKVSFGSFLFVLIVALFIDSLSPIIVLYSVDISVPSYVLWCSIAAFWTGVVLITAAGVHRHEVRTNMEIRLIQTWAYRVVRSPGVLGIILCYSGMYLLANHWLAVITLVVFTRVWLAPLAWSNRVSLKFSADVWHAYASKTSSLLPIPLSWVVSDISIFIWLKFWSWTYSCATLLLSFPHNLDTLYSCAGILFLLQVLSGTLGLVFARFDWFIRIAIGGVCVVAAWIILAPPMSNAMWYSGLYLVCVAYAVGCAMVGTFTVRLTALIFVLIGGAFIQGAWQLNGWKLSLE